MTIGETTMKIYKWVPISTNEQKKKHAAKRENKENTLTPKKVHDSSNSNFGMAEDSNTCKFTTFIYKYCLICFTPSVIDKIYLKHQY